MRHNKPPAHAHRAQRFQRYVSPCRRAALAGVVLAVVAVSCCLAWSSAAQARPTLSEDRARARAISAEIGSLDHALDRIVARFADATRRVETINADIATSEERLRVAEYQLAVAQRVLSERAVAMYKAQQVNIVDVLVSSASFGQMLHELEFLKKLKQSDERMVIDLERTRADVRQRRAVLLRARRVARRVVAERAAEKRRIEGALDERKAALVGLHDEIERLEAQLRRPVVKVTPLLVPAAAETAAPDPSAEPAANEEGWWPAIRQAAADNGISGTGLYRLMMIESGGNAAIVGGAGGHYCGLFQYAPETWAGAWNPWRGASIFDGLAQIKATALAIKMGKGPFWWNPSYQWAFGTN